MDFMRELTMCLNASKVPNTNYYTYMNLCALFLMKQKNFKITFTKGSVLVTFLISGTQHTTSQFRGVEVYFSSVQNRGLGP